MDVIKECKKHGATPHAKRKEGGYRCRKCGIESVTLDGREFPVASDAEAQRKLGGFENEFQANGNGTGRTIKTRVGWSLSGATISIDDDRGDHLDPLALLILDGQPYRAQRGRSH